jgi:methylated-DNA-[protein]-cysteine S-methyltransferase
MTYYTFVPSPVGDLMLTSDGTALTGVFMGAQKHGPEIGADWVQDQTAQPFPAARQQLADYFAGKRREFELPLGARGTAFQERVWQELCRIPYGTTISYGELARRIGKPGAARAVGLANGRNPVGIIVPCHRVIGADGSATGYGGGLERKKTLLDLEASS